MGKLIPLFPQAFREEDLPLTRDESIRLRLLANSVTAFQKEEDAVKAAIEKKCKDELDRLNLLNLKIRDLEAESEGIRRLARNRQHTPTAA